jgi:hypothetical protein
LVGPKRLGLSDSFLLEQRCIAFAR